MNNYFFYIICLLSITGSKMQAAGLEDVYNWLTDPIDRKIAYLEKKLNNPQYRQDRDALYQQLEELRCKQDVRNAHGKPPKEVLLGSGAVALVLGFLYWFFNNYKNTKNKKPRAT